MLIFYQKLIKYLLLSMGASGLKQRIKTRRDQAEKLDIEIMKLLNQMKNYQDSVLSERNKTEKSMATLNELIKEALDEIKGHHKQITNKYFSAQEENQKKEWKQKKENQMKIDWQKIKHKYQTQAQLYSNDLQVITRELPNRLQDLKHERSSLKNRNALLEQQFNQEQKILKSLRVSLSKSEFYKILNSLDSQHQFIIIQDSKLQQILCKFDNLSMLNEVWTKERVEARRKLQNFRVITIKFKEMIEHFKKEDLEKIEEDIQFQKLGIGILCVVCKKREKNCLNQTCLHIYCCFQCGSTLSQCPICHADMKPIKVYL